MAAQTQQERYDKLVKTAAECGIPSYMLDSVASYVVERQPVGHFLTAVLSNDLKEACERADDVNSVCLINYMRFFYNYAPSDCWGSPEKVKVWLEGGRND